MTLWHAVVLGVIQGLTEFLPISSTAHLRIVPALLGWDDPGAAYTAVIQIGTLVAVVSYFWKDIIHILQAMLQRRPEARLGWMIGVGTIPIVVFGVLFKHDIETTLRSLNIISASLIGLALVLWLAERVGRRTRVLAELSWLDAVVVGFAQSLALIPGVSRSGATIAGGLFLGMDRETAARFSFLLSLPAVAAAGVFELIKERHHLLDGEAQVLGLVTATVVAGIVGYASIAFLLRYLKTHSTFLFIIYRIALGAALLGLLAAGRLAA